MTQPAVREQTRVAAEATGAAAAQGYEAQEASEILAQARTAVDPELRRAVDALPVSMRRVARYHFGWEHADGTPATGNAGRPCGPPSCSRRRGPSAGGPSGRCGRLPPWS